MKVIFISNFFDHHAKPFSDEMSELTGGNYIFLGTTKMTEERIRLGWGIIERPSYVHDVNMKDEKDVKKWQEIVFDVDVVISGGVPPVLLKKRKNAKKITFEYTERLFKEGVPWNKLPILLLKNVLLGRMPHERHYMLSASAYNPYDYSLLKMFRGKCYRWGYFTECKYYDIDAIFARKENHRIETRQGVSILWAGRLIGWKHPEYPIMLAERLHKEGISFHMDIIGCGILEERIQEEIITKGLQDYVKMLGSMTPQEVRAHMEENDIFLFTSDKNEGWGAVLNESMNSCCGVVANRAIGSVPYLLENGKNGLVYKNDSFDEFYTNVKYLISHPIERKEMGITAYRTITEQWNAKQAAKNLLFLAKSLLEGNNTPIAEGPCSLAPKVKG